MRKQSILTHAVAMVAVLALGCVKTKLHYQAAPDLPPQGFRSVLVLAVFADLEYRQVVENTAITELRWVINRAVCVFFVGITVS